MSWATNWTTGRAWSSLLGSGVLAAVVWHTGSAPFTSAVGSLDVSTLVLGALLAVPITLACAWRWRLVSLGLVQRGQSGGRQFGGGQGDEVALGTAVASCYRSQFLNVTLPGGILGDLHRAVRHGLRAVVYERAAGQVVLVLVAVAVLLVRPPSVGPTAARLLPVALGILGVVGVVLALALARSVARGAWPGLLLTSAVAVVGHLVTWLVAARAVGVTAPTLTLLPLALLVLLAAGLPANLAGWGPREGMAAWAFAAAGLGADQGVAVATTYGVMVAVATLPGAVVLLAGAAHG
jgi:glycosyltransferase 2 family protein